jgi:hypothetical protein
MTGIGDLLFEPDSGPYRAATTPHNSTVVQQPAVVARPRNAAELGQVVRWAASRGLVMAVQASGHGAGAPIGADRVLIDTSGMTHVHVDADTRTADVGAGTTWSAVNSAAEKHGLLGLAGSSPSVAVAGYTFGGGVGWLARPYGMASSALLAVDYVDGAGRIRHASADAPDPVDRAALWAFRGGGGVGIATALTIELVAPRALWAGYQLWEITALAPVVKAWAQAMHEAGPGLTTSISVLHTPPGGPFPPSLRGVPIAHLAFASAAGEDAGGPLLRALRAAPPPTVDSSWAPADAARLAEIHLDPPDPLPALGIGRWLGPATPELAGEVLGVAAAADSPVAMIELRNVGNSAAARDGAMTEVPGPYLLHAVGLATDPLSRRTVEQALSGVGDAAQVADVGLAAASFAEGREEVADGLESSALRMLARLRAMLDPDGRIAPSRLSPAVSGV